MLSVQGIDAFYGQSHILHKVSLDIQEGECILLLGRNGAGKTTTIKSIMGILKPTSGKIRLCGHDITALAPFQIARMGVSYVPEERRIFPNLTVLENLLMGTVYNKKKLDIDKKLQDVFTYFPRLKERMHQRGDLLSGGEQQMLTLARGLISNPRLMLIDEPTEGLSPIIVQEISRILRKLQEDGVTMLIVEQNYQMALNLSDRLRAYVMEKGQIKMSGTRNQLMECEEDVIKCLGVKI